MQIPLLSICLITYNHEKYITEAIEGILMQQVNFNWELVIADDFSTDKTREIINKYKKKHPDNIKLIFQKENVGPAKNWLELMLYPKSKYIAYFEGDDYWTDPLKLQKQVDFMEHNFDYSGCFHNTLIKIENDSDPNLKPWRVYTKEKFSVVDTISTTSLFHTSSFLFRNEAMTLPPWILEVQSGDMALFALVANNGFLHRIDEYMSVYRKNEGGITNTISLIEYHKNRIILFEYFKTVCQPEFHYKIKEVINFHRLELVKLDKKGFVDRLRHLLKI